MHYLHFYFSHSQRIRPPFKAPLSYTREGAMRTKSGQIYKENLN